MQPLAVVLYQIPTPARRCSIQSLNFRLQYPRSVLSSFAEQYRPNCPSFSARLCLGQHGSPAPLYVGWTRSAALRVGVVVGVAGAIVGTPPSSRSRLVTLSSWSMLPEK